MMEKKHNYYVLLPTRGALNYLKRIDDDRYSYETEYGQWMRVIFSVDNKMIKAVDPPDGPFLEVGDKVKWAESDDYRERYWSVAKADLPSRRIKSISWSNDQPMPVIEFERLNPDA